MSTIIKQPDSLSFSGNLKKFEVTSVLEVAFELKQVVLINAVAVEVLILKEKYKPDSDGLLTFDIKAVVERLLDASIPGNQDKTTEQTAAVGNFIATVDTNVVAFTVIKGGVDELVGTANNWLAAHWLTWQPQAKTILQAAAEWLGIYTIAAGNVVVKAYYADNTTYTGNFAALGANKLISINTSWGAISAWLTAKVQNNQAVAWDVWYEVVENLIPVRKTPIQRYQLRNNGDEEHQFVWINTLGGIDSTSFTGSCENDQKLEHLNAMYDDNTIQEYDVESFNHDYRQSTGLLDAEASRWATDFFYSRKKYVIRGDGSLKPIAVIASKVVNSSADDEVDYEFTYRYAVDSQLLNLERTLTPLQPPEGLADFFLSELLSGLTAAQYSDNLNMAVQSPFAQIWQKLSLSQLWGGALPTLVDGTTITVIDGKLKVLIGTGGGSGSGGTTTGDTVTWEELRIYIDSLVNAQIIKDIRTELVSGAILWKEGLIYNALNISYKILGVNYTALDKEFPLEAADPTLSRIDLFYADSFGNVCVMKGTPAVNPTTPILDATQLFIMQVLITPGATAPAGMDMAVVYDENIEWTATEGHDTYVEVDLNSTFTPKRGSKRIQVDIAVPDNAISSAVHYIGKKYQGGVIFWLGEGGKYGLIAAEQDTASGVFWSSLSGSSVYSTGATGVEIGTGQANSTKMLANDAAKDDAVKYCDDLIIGEYQDWILPSEKELEAMHFRRFEIGYFGSKTYWSSTESAWNKARCINFGNGTPYTRDKNNSYCVRAIRAFDDRIVTAGLPKAFFTPRETKVMFVSPVTVSAKDGILSMYLKSSIPWRYNSILIVESYLAGVLTGKTSLSPSTSTQGYNSDRDTWQLIALPMAKFGSKSDLVDAFKISLAGSWPNSIDFGIDDIRFQHTEIDTAGVVVAPGTYGSIKKSAVITINAQGVVTNIIEVDTNPVDEIMIGAVNGVNRIYSTSGPYEPGTITVFINGFKERAFTEYSTTQIELAVAPKNNGFTDLIEAIYIKKQL